MFNTIQSSWQGRLLLPLISIKAAFIGCRYTFEVSSAEEEVGMKFMRKKAAAVDPHVQRCVLPMTWHNSKSHNFSKFAYYIMYALYDYGHDLQKTHFPSKEVIHSLSTLQFRFASGARLQH